MLDISLVSAFPWAARVPSPFMLNTETKQKIQPSLEGLEFFWPHAELTVPPENPRRIKRSVPVGITRGRGGDIPQIHPFPAGRPLLCSPDSSLASSSNSRC